MRRVDRRKKPAITLILLGSGLSDERAPFLACRYIAAAGAYGVMPLSTTVANEVILIVLPVSSTVGCPRFHNSPSFRLAMSLNGRNESVKRIEWVVFEWGGRHGRHDVVCGKVGNFERSWQMTKIAGQVENRIAGAGVKTPGSIRRFLLPGKITILYRQQ